MIHKLEFIMESDSDAPIMSSIYIGETTLGELALWLDDHYSGDDDYFKINKKDLENVVAVVNKYDLSIMAERIGIPVDEVREHLIDKFRDYGFISRRAYIRESFQNILNYILDNGGKYRLEEK